MSYDFAENHPLGTVWVTDRFSYLNIPRCASVSIKTMMRNQFAATHETTPRGPLFTVIRDPFDRLVSGIIKYADHNHHDLDGVIEETIRRLRWPPFYPFDEHTTPQHVFIVHPVAAVLPVEDLRVRLPALFEEWGLPVPNMGRENVTDRSLTRRVADKLRPHYSPTVFPLDTTIYRHVSHSDTVQGIVASGS